MRIEHAAWTTAEWHALARPAEGAVARLCAQFSRHYNAPVLAINAARNGLALVLRHLARREPSRSCVLLPAYICPAVIDAVRAAGLAPVFAPVGPDLNLSVAACESALRDARILAVVVAHMYGCPARVDLIEAVCARAGVFLIDDAAHAPGIEYRGRLLGGRGVAGLVSFAQSKTITTGVRGSGGLVIVNDESLLPGLAADIARLPPARARRAALLHFITDYLAPPFARRAAYYARRLHPGAPRDWYQPARLSEFEAAVALAQFARLDEIIAARKRVIEWYAARLPRSDAVKLAQYMPGRYLSRLMVRVADPAIRARLGARGIATRRGYSEVAGHLIELPLAVKMCAGDVERVCESLAHAHLTP